MPIATGVDGQDEVLVGRRPAPRARQAQQQTAGVGRRGDVHKIRSLRTIGGAHGARKVLSILQEVRSDLEAAHRETLQKDPNALFDAQAVLGTARPGMIVVDNTAPVFREGAGA